MNIEKQPFKIAEKFKMAARHECSIIQSKSFETLDLETSTHKKNIVKVTFYNSGSPPTTVLYFQILHRLAEIQGFFKLLIKVKTQCVRNYGHL
jgi:hypothetical protein